MQVRLKLALQFSMHASGSELEETEQCLAVFITGSPSFFFNCISQRMQSQHTYRLKRTKPRESLGLVLGSGEKVISECNNSKSSYSFAFALLA